MTEKIPIWKKILLTFCVFIAFLVIFFILILPSTPLWLGMGITALAIWTAFSNTPNARKADILSVLTFILWVLYVYTLVFESGTHSSSLIMSWVISIIITGILYFRFVPSFLEKILDMEVKNSEYWKKHIEEMRKTQSRERELRVKDYEIP
ncbi:hypothetical protein LCGC14_0302710 [marine sediment metagenome]|uniref:Uncharacterized protein n=1 Tax=marine sediment metagenome TaxID=412755 RepID=A0A0F9TUK7_9ZZZZ